MTSDLEATIHDYSVDPIAFLDHALVSVCLKKRTTSKIKSTWKGRKMKYSFLEDAGIVKRIERINRVGSRKTAHGCLVVGGAKGRSEKGTVAV